MTPELPDDAYLRWLYSQVSSVRQRNPSRSYWNLIRKFYRMEFVWFIPNDDNRIADGFALRHEFLEQFDYLVDEEWLHSSCSFLELLVALSRRLAFEAEGQPRAWFWHMLKNIELDQITDDVPFPEQLVEDVVSNVIWRTYRADGHGGLFPLRNAKEDQTRVEIWYQLCAYLLQ